jgi:membrane protein
MAAAKAPGANRGAQDGAPGPHPPAVIDVPPKASLVDASKRAFANFRAQDMTDYGAALTYYGMMSLFPLIVVAVSLFALVASPATVTDFISYLARNGADPNTRDAIDATMRNIVKSSGGTAGAALVVSTLIALNGASGAFGAAGRAINRVYAVEEDRGFVRRKLIDLAMTLVIVVLLLIVVVALFLGGGIAEDVFGLIGLGATAADVWAIARWPAALGAAIAAFALIYAFAPDITPRKIRWLSPGAIGGVAIWIIASAGFAVYIKNLSSYGAAYGAAGAVIVLMLWLWISSCALLLGAALNAEVERAETAGRGGPPMVTPPPPFPEAEPPHPTSTDPASRGR